MFRLRPSPLRRRHLVLAAGLLALGTSAAFGQSRGRSVDEIIEGLSRGSRGIRESPRPAPEPAPPGQAQPSLLEGRAQPPARTPEGMDFDDMTFAFGSADLDAQGRDVARQLGLALNSPRLAGSRFLIIGHTDAVGSDAVNLALSRRRATVVRNFLVQEMNIDRARLRTDGRGRYELKRPQTPNDGINRRVEVRPDG